MEEVLGRPAGGALPVVCLGLNAPVKHRLSDETLNRGPNSLWSLQNPMALLVMSRGVTPVSRPNSHHSWPPNNPHPLDWLYVSLSSPPVASVW